MRAGRLVLLLSAAGYPLTELAVRRLGSRGAVLTESVCAGLLIRDASMLAAGVPHRLRPVPAALLRLETGAAAAAVAAGIRPARAPAARRTAVAALFALHTVRFWIYLRPDQGRRTAS
ncbi:MAG TPA: hypothetical protein VMT74_14130, partial [Gaiellaceae bacterium]|nr:hypothetical protein [Gaiellaceae bacterium]